MATTTERKPRTRRVERGTYADGGSVRQEGPLPLYECTTCGREVVWATSTKTGRKYLVNTYQYGEAGSYGLHRSYYVKSSPHRCTPSA